MEDSGGEQSDQEDGGLTQERYQQMNEFWELRRRVNESVQESIELRNSEERTNISLRENLILRTISSRRKRNHSNTSSSSSSSESQNSLADDGEAEAAYINLLFRKRTNIMNLTSLIRRREITKRKLLKKKFITHAVERFRMEKTLPGHDGCVNAIGWSKSGNLLCSGSDDQTICLHEPFSSRTAPVSELITDHVSNIFQTQFLPYANDRIIISSARDGLVSMSQIDETGSLVVYSTEQFGNHIIKHRKSCHKICFIPDSQVILSCGEDGVVYRYDPREPVVENMKPLLIYKCMNHSIFGTQLHTIDSSPVGWNFAIGGHYHSASVFDYRKISDEKAEPVMEIYPAEFENLKTLPNCPNITALRYNHTGQQLVASYNDEEIHLFDAKIGGHLRSFGGHRNSQTVKGVNFYGRQSEYVISGSDCGHLFVWKTETGELMNYQFADGDKDTDPGVLNALEPHPNLPYLATSGLDSTVKLWSPTGLPFLDGATDEIEIAKKGALANRRNRLCYKASDCNISQLSAIVRLLSRRSEHVFVESEMTSSDSESDNPTNCRPS